MTRSALFVEWLIRRGGVAHSAEARAAGFSPHAVARAIAEGAVVSPRRSWLHTRDADAGLVAAVSAGGRLTCLSAAARHGLWVRDSATTHIAVKPTASRVPADGFTVHWSRGPAPTSRYAVEEPLLNALFHIAGCVPREEALATWESAVRKGLVAAERLARVEWRSTRARELAALCTALSDSGLETIFVERLRPLGLRLRQQVWLDGHAVDVLIGDRLVVQLDGFEHHRHAADRRRDIEADARLALLGYTVLRFDWKQVLFGWSQVEETVLHAVAQGLHVAVVGRRR